jgi:hypothetical protein
MRGFFIGVIAMAANSFNLTVSIEKKWYFDIVLKATFMLIKARLMSIEKATNLIASYCFKYAVK